MQWLRFRLTFAFLVASVLGEHRFVCSRGALAKYKTIKQGQHSYTVFVQWDIQAKHHARTR
ncbi:MAG: hypothetical protein ACI8VW_002084 [bacterium]|jgi:hypothetical protein